MTFVLVHIIVCKLMYGYGAWTPALGTEELPSVDAAVAFCPSNAAIRSSRRLSLKLLWAYLAK